MSNSPGKVTLACVDCATERVVYRSQVYGASPRYALPGIYRCAGCNKAHIPGRPPKPKVSVTCQGCGSSKELIPSQAARLQTPFFCKTCRPTTCKPLPHGATCSRCGEVRTIPAKGLRRRKTTLCRSCYLGVTKKPRFVVKTCPGCKTTRRVKRHQMSAEALCFSCKSLGATNPNWRGGIGRKGYAPTWTFALKALVYRRDRYRCQECGEKKTLTTRFAVHHIDYDKQNSCPSNLILLCNRCHGKTNGNRAYWTVRFKEHLSRKGASC